MLIADFWKYVTLYPSRRPSCARFWRILLFVNAGSRFDDFIEGRTSEVVSDPVIRQLGWKGQTRVSVLLKTVMYPSAFMHSFGK
jgi:hypothetical protein